MFRINLYHRLESPVYIASFGSFSPLGNDSKEVWKQYLSDESLLGEKNISGKKEIVGSLSDELQQIKNEIKASNSNYSKLDDSVLYAILASRKALENSGWSSLDFGINIGSSRGATKVFEQSHQEFINTGKTPVLTSPTTTLGNISYWVAQDLKAQGPEISHSITCSTSFHAILNGIAWIKSGMSERFLVGGSEAPLTDFTIAQMKALKIYTSKFDDYPCRSLDLHKTKNTMVLGEGASVVCLDKNKTKNTIAKISGIGYATETLSHGISITDNAECLQKSMQMALQNTDYSSVDVVIMHAPGTLKGDLSEYKAVEQVFGENIPLLTTNKWKIGHTLGASGTMSLELALLMLEHQKFMGVPFTPYTSSEKQINKILINAVGFGSNAVSILVEKV